MTQRKIAAADPWITKPEVIRRFLDLRPRYEAMCQEVQYIIGKRLADSDIEVSAVTSRAKTLNSFLEKLDRKSYKDPFSDITDFAGVRVVCLYLDDIHRIERIISKEFEVLEKVDRFREREPDRFGYGAVHFIVRLGKRPSGARYDDLKTLVCEIQVRTVLQDAWAIIDHHLVYKNEAAVPRQLQRKLNSLSGLFETADDQFQQIRTQRLEYVDTVRDSIDKPDSFLATELNLDSLREYLKWRFPGMNPEGYIGQLGMNLESIQKGGYALLADIERELDDEAIEQATAAIGEMQRVAKTDSGGIPSAPLLACALAIVNPKVFEAMRFTPGNEAPLKQRLRHPPAKGPGRSKRTEGGRPNKAIDSDKE
jgi:ppGpp synthetase/RelA/SpoT-type nucleotidyltranferase